MKVLAAFESSGVVREAFRARGHDAWSCDLLPSDDDSIYHFRDDIRRIAGIAKWDLLIAHPPCTYLCSSGLHWNKRVPGRAEKTEQALDMVRWLLGLGVPRLCVENPIGRIGTAIRKADQIIHPHQFGEDASKATCLWLRGLPLLRPTSHYPGRIVGRRNGKPVFRWGNQTDSGQNRLGPSPDRWKRRSQTYPGIARAMAEQWG